MFGSLDWELSHVGVVVTAWASLSFFLTPPVPVLLLPALVEVAVRNFIWDKPSTHWVGLAYAKIDTKILKLCVFFLLIMK